MKLKNLIVIGIVCTVVLFAFTGCGSKSDEGTSGETAAQEQVEAVPETVVQNTAEQITESADVETTVDEFEGSWVGVDDATLFVNITKAGDQYEYEDNDGKYQASFSEGILKVVVAENDTADVYVDKESGNLVLVYMDSTIQYVKK